MGGYTKDQFLARLKKLQVEFSTYDHPTVLTVEAQAKYVGHLGGGLTKNLFLKDKKHRYYVISALAGTTVDLKVLSQRLGLGKGGLRMAPEEALQEILKVPLGCVTPFAIVNESAQCVSLLLDQGFKAQKFCLFHPLSNDMTIALRACDLDKFLLSIGKSPSYVDLEATPLVGKDQPPDLAALVPSGVPALVDQPVKNVQDGVLSDSEAHVLVKKKISSEGEAISKPINVRKAPEKVEIISKSLAEFVDVGRLIDELIDKTTAAVLTEVSKESEQQSGQLKPIQEGVKKRIGPDLENLTMSLKNAAYTEGFHSGVRSVLQRGFQGLSSGR